MVIGQVFRNHVLKFTKSKRSRGKRTGIRKNNFSPSTTSKSYHFSRFGVGSVLQKQAGFRKVKLWDQKSIFVSQSSISNIGGSKKEDERTKCSDFIQRRL